MKRIIVPISLWLLLVLYIFGSSSGLVFGQVLEQNGLKETIPANPIWRSHPQIKVGEHFTIRYMISPTNTLLQGSIYQDDISYASSDSLYISSIKTEVIHTITERGEGSTDIMLEIKMIAKHPGIQLISPIIIFNTITVTLPYVYIYSVLDTDRLYVVPMNQYIPMKEIVLLLVLLLVIMICVFVLVSIIRRSTQSIRKFFYQTKDVVNMCVCYIQVEAVSIKLQRGVEKRRRKFTLSYECYLYLLTIIRKRINFMYANNNASTNANAKTPEEIENIFITNIHIDEAVKSDMLELFSTFDMVLYGNKKIPIKDRIYHCGVCKKLLGMSLRMREDVYYDNNPRKTTALEKV